MKLLITFCLIFLSVFSVSAQVENASVLAYPNPAKYEVSFSYNSAGATSPVIIIITDMIGSKIGEFSIRDKQGMLNWNTSAIPNGVYIFKLKDATKTLAVGKLTIAK